MYSINPEHINPIDHIHHTNLFKLNLFNPHHFKVTLFHVRLFIKDQVNLNLCIFHLFNLITLHPKYIHPIDHIKDTQLMFNLHV